MARDRYRRMAKLSAFVTIVALITACAAFLLLHGPLRQFAGALIAMCIVTVIGAQVVFFWALVAGCLNRPEPSQGD
ncbi:MAG TPA: hypothetical protein VMK32_01315 [Burkholderiaceae bacterium]|nr:hypothetical protein [Burkholderiaceae bacterium]